MPSERHSDRQQAQNCEFSRGEDIIRRCGAQGSQLIQPQGCEAGSRENHNSRPVSELLPEGGRCPKGDEPAATDRAAEHIADAIFESEFKSPPVYADRFEQSCIAAPAFQFEGFELAPPDWRP